MVAFAASLFMGCEKDLNLLPPTEVSESVFFAKENDFKIFANQFYGQLPDLNLVNRDNWSDILYTHHNISNSTYIESQESSLWSNSYRNIRNTNILIERVEGLTDQSLKDQVLVYEGEAKFFRAFNYFNLLKEFGGVILVDKVLTLEDTDILYGAKSSREQILDFIVKDLDDAIALPLGSLTSSGDIGRITKEAALAFKARVCLFEGTWRKYHNSGGDANVLFTKAIDASDQVLASGKYELFKRTDVLGDKSYFYSFILENEAKCNPAGLTKNDSREYILVNKFNKKDRSTGGMAYVNDNFSPTKKMADMYLDKTGLPISHANSVFKGYSFTIDPVTKVPTNLEYLDRDPRMYNNMIPPFQQFWYHIPYDRKYDVPTLNTGCFYDGFWTSATGYMALKFLPEIGGNMGIDYPVIRLAEVMLIYAEAIYEKNGAISDGELDKSINKLRERVDMPHLTNGFVSANGLNMLNEIRRERTVELFAEGFRFDDLRRWKTAAAEMSMDVRGIKWRGTAFAAPFEVYNPRTETIVTVDHTLKAFAVDADGFAVLEAAGLRQFLDKHYLLPLPLRQLALNPQLEQNPGWIK